MKFSAASIAIILEEEISAMPLGGYLKDQQVTKKGNVLEFELLYVKESDKGRKFKITVEEI